VNIETPDLDRRDFLSIRITTRRCIVGDVRGSSVTEDGLGSFFVDAFNRHKAGELEPGELEPVAPAPELSGDALELATLRRAYPKEVARRMNSDAELRKQSCRLESLEKRPAKKLTVNERMMLELPKDARRVGWSKREWAEHLKCSDSAVVGAPFWGTIMSLREQQKQSRPDQVESA